MTTFVQCGFCSPDTGGNHATGCPNSVSRPRAYPPRAYPPSFPFPAPITHITMPAKEGWVCPKCGSVWAPVMIECSTCNGPIRKAKTAGQGHEKGHSEAKGAVE